MASNDDAAEGAQSYERVVDAVMSLPATTAATPSLFSHDPATIHRPLPPHFRAANFVFTRCSPRNLEVLLANDRPMAPPFASPMAEQFLSDRRMDATVADSQVLTGALDQVLEARQLKGSWDGYN